MLESHRRNCILLKPSLKHLNYYNQVNVDGAVHFRFYWTGYGYYSGIELSTPTQWTITTTETDPVLEESNQNYYLTIQRDTFTNTTWNLTMNGTASLLFSFDSSSYNATIYSANTSTIIFITNRTLPSVTSDTFTNLTWTYNLTIPELNGQIISNQTIANFGLDNCSVFTTRAYNISVLDETTDNLITGNASIDAYFLVYLNNHYYNFSITWDNNNTYGLCIYPDTTSYNVTLAQFEYGSLGYDNKNYYWNNVILSNVTKQLDLYLTNGTSMITITVVDENDNRIEDAFVYIQSYDLGTDTYTTTEIVRTDFNGQAVAQMVLYTQWYRFLVVYQGNVVLTTGSKKILTNSIFLTITLGSNNLGSYDIVNGINCNVSYSNTTTYFTYTWVNPTGESVIATLEVYKVTTYTDLLINSSSTTSASGTIFLSIGTPTNNTYTAKCYITLDGQRFICGTPTSYEYGGSWRVYGTNGIFLSFLLIVFLVCVGAWSPVASIVLMLIGFFVSYLTGLFHLSPSILISLIIIGGITLYKLSRRE